MLHDFLQINIFAFMLVFARLGTAFVLLPGVSGIQVPIRMRLSLALAVSLLITPLVIDRLPSMPGSPLVIFVLLGAEVLAGAILGTIPLILLSAVHVAGTIISFTSAMANALAYDPIVQQQSSIVSGFLATTATLLIFVTDMHHLFIRAILDSYELFQPGIPPDIGDAAHLIARHVADTFRVGVQLSAPFLIVGFAYYVGLGILTRLAPQIPIFFVAMPLQLVVSIVIMMIAVSGIMLAALNHMAEGMRPFLLQ